MGPATPPDRDELFQALRELLLAIGHELSVEGTVRLCADRLAERPNVALVGVWLLDDRAKCLHLVASASRTRDGRADWVSITGAVGPVPLGEGLVGQVAMSTEPVVIDVAADPGAVHDPGWMRAEGIVSFVGQPIIHAEVVLGVIGMLSRIAPVEEVLLWLRVIADFAAASIANARAFQEIHQLRHLLELENEYLQTEILDAKAFGDIIGSSAGLANVLERIQMVAPTDSNVLILGESGTGKELVAREIHKHSKRADRPMIRVNCAAIPEELFESEFFGHVRGAFTGATRDRAGRFHVADKGTIFLDEVSEIPTTVQAKLLRVLQEQEFERVGDERTHTVDVRVVAASNRDLKGAVEAGTFRDDLYYRLNVFPIAIPPLRERKDDIAPIAAAFVTQAARRIDRSVPTLTRFVVEQLEGYDWPGNVRELQNVLERAMIVSRDGPLRLDIAPAQNAPATTGPPASTGPPAGVSPPAGVVTDAEMRRRERDNVVAALGQCGWRVYGPKGAAKLLGLAPSTLLSRMQRMDIKRPG